MLVAEDPTPRLLTGSIRCVTDDDWCCWPAKASLARARWQNPHAITAGFLPCITIDGAARCVAGFQSATSNRLRVRPTEKLARLVGTVATTLVSVPVACGAVAEPSTGNAHAGTSNGAPLVCAACGDCAPAIGHATIAATKVGRTLLASVGDMRMRSGASRPVATRRGSRQRSGTEIQ